MAEEIIMPMHNQLEDSFLANPEKYDGDENKCDGKQSNVLMNLKAVKKECGILKKKVARMTRVNNDLRNKIPENLREDFEKQPYKVQFVQLQKDQLTTERDGLLLQLEHENDKYASVLRKLDEQSKTMEEINNEFLRELSERKKLRAETLSALMEQEQNHSLEMNKLNQTILENTCAICLSPWDTFGEHRLASLACGHLFGDDCIKICLSRAGECPTCRSSAHTGDLRYICDRYHSL
ncbi:E3 ubiquitin-protein ligase RNF8-like [Drosophila miranda]|uniref:E3 ubiquitin-protein ligase RNF8-like n=1 Tax=Drosophila miranda TaxID=7229 RepID=UPI0007E818C6|nr:E3 ubiquitin-protein ligase RNF8-like [Drosophila miranda]